jgi:hypothetical protein
MIDVEVCHPLHIVTCDVSCFWKIDLAQLLSLYFAPALWFSSTVKLGIMLFLWIRPLVKCCSWYKRSQVRPNTKVHFEALSTKVMLLWRRTFSILLYYFMSDCFFLWTSKMGTLHTTNWVGMPKHLSSHAKRSQAYSWCPFVYTFDIFWLFHVLWWVMKQVLLSSTS